MNLPGGMVYILFAAISLLSAAIAVLLTAYVQRALARRRGDAPDPRTPEDGTVASLFDQPRSYEFQDGVLVSGIGPDDAFLGPETDRSAAFAALTEAIATLHPDLPDCMTALARRGEAFFLIGYLGPDALSVAGRTMTDRIVVSVMPAEDAGGRRAVDARSFDAVGQEAVDLRRALSLSAAVQWKETADRRVVWANQPYLHLAERASGAAADRLGWPLPRIFDDQLAPPPPEGTLRRCLLNLPDRVDPHWFEVAAMPLHGDTVLYSARSIDRLVATEAALRDFVQTLSKTFATLPIGLAVFDRKRELVLFNPALVSISMLEPGYLSQRPTLRAFLDQLRERQRMPEPRDYRGWRAEIERLEQGAEAGTYHEFWTLAGGASLRVTGRPHPDGAIAFIFEDVSQEVSVTRRFRADFELDRAILDDAGAALIVLDREGQVLRTNAAYDAMWAGRPPAATLTEASRRWHDAFAPTGLWGEIRQFAAHEVDRASWTETVLSRDGAAVQCRVAPLRGGHTIVWFLTPEGPLADPLSGWLPPDGPTRAELAPGSVVDGIAAQG
jgi:PAS domain-containing protein